MYCDPNKRDIELLMTNPHQFLIESQGIVDFNIKHFIHLGKFKHTEFDEIKQQINEELLTRIHKIRIQFQGRSLLRTYFSVIVKNVCNEIVRKGDRPDYVQLDEAKMNHASDETIYSLIFELIHYFGIYHNVL